MRKSLKISICSILLVSTCVIYSGCTNKDILSSNNKTKIKNVSQSDKDNMLDLSLYFDSTSDPKKTEVTKEDRVIQTDELLGELIIHELIKGPATVSSKSKPILPKETRLLSFSIKDGIAYVNLSGEAVVKMSSSKEEACLKSIVLSLCQLSTVQKIMIQINNKNVETLGGNFNISKPLGKEDIETAKIKK